MTPIFAIGDIHGHLGELHAALERIATDAEAGAPVVFLGDSVDRGPDARGVLQTLVDGLHAGQPWITLMGNHDHCMRDFLNGAGQQPSDRLSWLDPVMGGSETLASYGVDVDPRRRVESIRADAREAVPAEHAAFLDRLELMHVTADQIFVHAGIRPGVPLEAQNEHDLIWIRGPFLDHEEDFGRLVVHGHTALRAPRHHGNRLNLDSGAGYGRPLTAALIRGRDAWALKVGGRSPILG